MGADDFVEQVPPGHAGARLRQAREAAGLGLAELSALTRIRERHLEALEAGELSALPGRTYVLGFARTYARVLGLDENGIVREFRADLDGALAEQVVQAPAVTLTPGDPARVPSRGFAWLATIAAVVVVVAGLVFWRQYYSPSASLPSLLPEATSTPPAQPAPPKPASPGPAPGPAAPATSPVVFTALESNLWVKFYDASGKQLMQKTLAQGESWTVPADAQGPRIWTGRPDALSVSVGGKVLGKLAAAPKPTKDLPVDGAALLALLAPAATPAPGATQAPPVSASPVPAASPSPIAQADEGRAVAHRLAHRLRANAMVTQVPASDAGGVASPAADQAKPAN